jgi:hypothetical protein
MRRTLFSFLTLFLALPLSAQAWDLRLEVPFPEGQSLSGTAIGGAIQMYSGTLDKGNGALFSVYHRLFRVGPILRLDWGGEAGQLKTTGTIERAGLSQLESKLRQTGSGIGLNAQIWLPFTGIGGEVGAIQRIQKYDFTTDDAESSSYLGRLWLRVGVRYKLPMVGIHPYVTASYQQPLNKDNPVEVHNLQDLQELFAKQGSGQEFKRMWTFGVGVMF